MQTIKYIVALVFVALFVVGILLIAIPRSEASECTNWHEDLISNPHHWQLVADWQLEQCKAVGVAL